MSHRQPQKEVVLLCDDDWINVQTKTFLNWINNALSSRGIRLDDLERDFEDGLELVALVEILSGRKIHGINRKPRVRQAKGENLCLALEEVKLDGVKLINIGAEDILDHNKKIILGLIWALILRYQIVGIEAGSPKALLLAWVNQKIAPYPVAKVTNFKHSWADGDAITALTDAMQPGICPLNGKSGNNTRDIDRAMHAANEGLEPGIPMLMEPQWMANAVDDLSCMTYISMFKDWEENQDRRREDRKKAGHCYMEGPGLERGITDQPNEFTIYSHDPNGNMMRDGGDRFDVTVACEEHGHQNETVAKTQIFDNNDGTYRVTYETSVPGRYNVAASYKNFPIKNSPKTVMVEGAIDPRLCYAEGPGLGNNVRDNEPTDFKIFSVGPGGPLNEGGNDVEVRVRGPNNAPCDVAVDDRGDGTYDVAYCAEEPGKYEIDVLVNGDHINGSTFNVYVEPKICAGMVTGVFTFTAQARDMRGNPIRTGGADWRVAIQGPGGSRIDVQTQDHQNGEYSAKYALEAAERSDSEFRVTCTLDGEHVGGSPFKHQLGPKPSMMQRMTNAFKGITGRGSARTAGGGGKVFHHSGNSNRSPPGRGLPSTPQRGGGGGAKTFCQACGKGFLDPQQRFCQECGKPRF